MNKIPQHIFISFDSCAFHPAEVEERNASCKILEIIEKYDVEFSIPAAVFEETGNAPIRIKSMAHANIFNYDCFEEDKQECHEIAQKMFGKFDSLPKNIQNDVRCLQCARKYGCTYFVTYDIKHILKNKHKIYDELCFEALTPKECLEKLKCYLN